MVKPTLSIFSGTKNLGNVFKEQNQIVSKFIEFNVPLTDTEGRFSSQLLGKSRLVMVQGSHTGEGFDGTDPEEKLGDFVYEMEQWVNANIQSSTSVTYTDSLDTSYNVDCVDWTWTRTFDSPGRILYSLIMKQK